MSEPTEAFKEKYREEGRRRAWGAAAGQYLTRLENIAASDDIEAALEEEIMRLKNEHGAPNASDDALQERQLRQVNDAAAVGAGRQPIDNGDRVAAGLGLLELPASAWAQPPRAADGMQRDNEELVAAAMNLQPAPKAASPKPPSNEGLVARAMGGAA